MTPEQNAHVKTLTEKKEIFDYVVDHLRQQAAQARRANVCSYRGKNNTMCAVGCLLADDEYVPSMEGNPADRIELPHRLKPHVDMLQALQSFHDNEDCWNNETCECSPSISFTGGISPWGENQLEIIHLDFGIK